MSYGWVTLISNKKQAVFGEVSLISSFNNIHLISQVTVGASVDADLSFH